MNTKTLRVIGHIGIVLTWMWMSFFFPGHHYWMFLCFGIIFSFVASYNKPISALGGMLNTMIHYEELKK